MFGYFRQLKESQKHQGDKAMYETIISLEETFMKEIEAQVNNYERNPSDFHAAAFRMIDRNGDGKLQKAELINAMMPGSEFTQFMGFYINPLIKALEKHSVQAQANSGREPNEWVQLIDQSSGRNYYYNLATEASAWRKPESHQEQVLRASRRNTSESNQSTQQVVQGRRSSSQSKTEVKPMNRDEQMIMNQLCGKKVSDLKKLAYEEGVSHSKIEAAENASNPRSELIGQIILRNRQATGQEEVVVVTGEMPPPTPSAGQLRKLYDDRAKKEAEQKAKEEKQNATSRGNRRPEPPHRHAGLVRALLESGCVPCDF